MSNVPTSIWQGSFRLFGVDVRCHVLSDGQRVIEADSMEELFEAMANGEEIGDIDEGFARWIHGKEMQ
jgi:hypothetical protein